MRGQVRLRHIAACGLLIGCVGLKRVLAVKNKNAVDAQFGQRVVSYNAVCENHILMRRPASGCVFIKGCNRARRHDYKHVKRI